MAAVAFAARQVERQGERLELTRAEREGQQTKKLIAGPNVYICDGCIGLGVEIMEEDEADWYRSFPRTLNQPWSGEERRAQSRDE